MAVLKAFVFFEALSSIWYGIVLKVLWDWFIVSTFGLPNLSLPIAIGVGLVASLLSHQYIPTDDKDTPIEIIYSFLYPFMLLIIGFVVRLFV